MTIDTVVFDFDGTLAELHLDFPLMKLRVGELADRFLAPARPPATLPALEAIAWISQSIEGQNGGRAADFRKEALGLIEAMEMEAAGRGALFPFTRPLLDGILLRGLKTAIITRNCEAAVRVVFPDIARYCSAFLARDHVPAPKPDPAHLLLALRAMGATPAAAVMVGDHPLDIQTGKAAGVMTAGVCSGSKTREELIHAGADWVADDCEALFRMFAEKGVLRR
ncbi:MAG: HAD family hydrolase [Desulfobacteraceae bacterium]|nr:HAD family hydrolase [Desulfobacteraceae bacterium]